MFRSLGVLVSEVCHELLCTLDPSHQCVTHDPYMAETRIYTAIHRREDGTDNLRANLRRQDWKKAARNFSVQNDEGTQPDTPRRAIEKKIAVIIMALQIQPLRQ